MIQFTHAPIVLPAFPALTQETGAEVEFRGIVRQTENGSAIAGLEYEAHIPMAERRLKEIIADISREHAIQAVWFIHRLGWVPVGEASLYVRVHAAHRGPAFHACMDLIDLLKKDVPIWKLTPGASAAASSQSGSI